jgi:hypothetical protein
VLGAVGVGDGVLGSIGVGDGCGVVGAVGVGDGVAGGCVVGCVVGCGVDGCVVGVVELGPVDVCGGDDGADHGGVGAVGVAVGRPAGNQLLADPGVPASRPAAVGWSVGSCVGVPVVSSGVDPSGLPTGGLVVVRLDAEDSLADGRFSDAAGAGGTVVADSFARNGTKRKRPASASTVAARAPSFRTGGPPYLPIGPRTGRPSWSTQNDHPGGAFGQERSGLKFFGGRHRTFGGSGHPGGGLNCLKGLTFHPQVAWQLTQRARGHKAGPRQVSRS